MITEPPVDARIVSVYQLYNMLTDDDINVLIMDVRPDEQFEESHIKHKPCINVPAEIVPPGYVYAFISPQLCSACMSVYVCISKYSHIYWGYLIIGPMLQAIDICILCKNCSWSYSGGLCKGARR